MQVVGWVLGVQDGDELVQGGDGGVEHAGGVVHSHLQLAAPVVAEVEGLGPEVRPPAVPAVEDEVGPVDGVQVHDGQKVKRKKKKKRSV
jgi:hypothetical protein